MRASALLLAFAITATIAFAASLPATASDPQLAALSAPRAAGSDLLQRWSARNAARVAQAACGLCTNVDCCGGSANGWKLCRSNCPSGQYKCMQVATCP